MKYQRSATAVLACATLLAALPAAAQQPSPQYYAGLQAGVHDLEDWNADVDLGANILLQGHLELEGQRQAGLFIGREYTHTRFEIEYQRGDFDISDVQLGAIGQRTSGSGDYQALTANAYWQQHFTASFSGYLGIGIGWGETSLPRITFTHPCNCMDTADETDLVYQLRVGAEYRFADNHNLFVQYTHLELPGPQSSTGGVRYQDKEVGIAALGYRFHFE